LKNKIYKFINIPVVLYGCEACSITIRKEHSLRMFENWVLRGIFGSEGDEEAEENLVMRRFINSCDL
jgi:hypothetical protein